MGGLRLLIAAAVGAGCASGPRSGTDEALFGGEVVGLAYSGYRAGQSPNRPGELPTKAQIREDLDLILGAGVRLIRQYAAGPLEQRVLEVIAEDGRPIRVLQGAWLEAELSAHETCAWLTEPIPPEQLARNRRRNGAELTRVIELAHRYPAIIAAVSVGNETLVTWNDHLVSVSTLQAYLRTVGQSIAQPVSTADNYLAWVEHAEALRGHVDFALIHTYPVWEGKTLEEAIPFTQANLAQVRKALPGRPVVVGEAGWPSNAVEFGGRASERAQTRYVTDLVGLARREGFTVFVFEAFDEDWKGGPDPGGAEKHWGLFDVHRQPKRLLRERGRL